MPPSSPGLTFFHLSQVALVEKLGQREAGPRNLHSDLPSCVQSVPRDPRREKTLPMPSSPHNSMSYPWPAIVLLQNESLGSNICGWHYRNVSDREEGLGRGGVGEKGKGKAWREGQGLHRYIKRQWPLNTMGAPRRDLEQKGHQKETWGPLNKVYSLVSFVLRLISELLINTLWLYAR